MAEIGMCATSPQNDRHISETDITTLPPLKRRMSGMAELIYYQI
jgi:hypothetical protein